MSHRKGRHRWRFWGRRRRFRVDEIRLKLPGHGGGESVARFRDGNGLDSDSNLVRPSDVVRVLGESVVVLVRGLVGRQKLPDGFRREFGWPIRIRTW